MDIIRVERKILQRNEDFASQNRALFKKHGVNTINMISSPGSGKTSLIERTVDALNREVRVAVIAGDVQTENDAKRLVKHNIPVAQIVTRGACHLDASLVKNVLDQLDLSRVDLLLIENVGNLVCPAAFDLGEDFKIAVVSVTEGEDKPLKYPKIFLDARAVVINKMDLLPYLNFDLRALEKNVKMMNPSAKIFKTSCVSGEGIKEWAEWLIRCKSTYYTSQTSD